MNILLKDNADKAQTTLDFQPVSARYVRYAALKPDGPGQPGGRNGEPHTRRIVVLCIPDRHLGKPAVTPEINLKHPRPFIASANVCAYVAISRRKK